MNEIPTGEQYIRFVLQGLSNGTSMQLHEFSQRGTTYYVRNVPSRISLINRQQLILSMIKHGSNIEAKNALKIVQGDEGYIA